MRLWSIAPKLAAAAFVIAIPVFLVTANVRFLVSDVGFYQKGLRDHNAVEATGIALPELDRAAQEIIDYFENDAATLRIVVLNQGQEEPLFNSKEVQHMQDVKRLMRFVYRLNEVSLVIVLSYICCVVLWTRSKGLRSLARESMMGVGVGFGALAFVGVFALTGFDETWNRFHKIVFRNDLWQLDPETDHLIQMFPEPFWQGATYLVGALTLAEAAVIVLTATVYLFASRGEAVVAGGGLVRPLPVARAATRESEPRA